MLNAGVEGLGCRVLCETEDVATADAGQPPGPGDQQEAQGSHAAQDVAVRALAGAAARSGDGVELKAPGDVVGENAELLPGAVRAGVAGRCPKPVPPGASACQCRRSAANCLRGSQLQ